MAEYKKLFVLLSEEVKLTKEIVKIEKEVQSLVLKEQQVTGEELGKSMSDSYKIQKNIDEISLCLEILENDVPRLILDQKYNANDTKWNWVDSTKYKDVTYLNNSENYDKLMHTWNNIGEIYISLGEGFTYMKTTDDNNFNNNFSTRYSIPLWHDYESAKILRFYSYINKLSSNISMTVNENKYIHIKLKIDDFKTTTNDLNIILKNYRRETGQIFKKIVSTVIELNGDHFERKKHLENKMIEYKDKLSNLKKQQQDIKKSLDIDPDISSDLFDDNKSEASYSFLSDT